MPYVINGIGTWYWGKKSIHARHGVCEFCAAQAELRSYETTLYFVVVFIPLIPLGRKRILDECSACKRHRVIPLKKWEELRTKSVAEAVKAMREDPQNAAKATEAIQALVTFRDESNLLAIAPALRQLHGGNFEIQKLLGSAYAFFGRAQEAGDAFRAALALNDTPDLRETIGALLVRQGRPDEARPYLAHVLQQKLRDKLPFIGLLVDGYQAKGKHVEALEVLAECEAAFPDLAEDKDFLRKRKVSEKHKATGKPITAPALQQPMATHSQGGEWRVQAPRYVGLAVVLVALATYLGAAFYQGAARPVHLVNGLKRAYQVEINGQKIKLPPQSATQTKIAEGEISVKVLDAELGIPDKTCRIETPFFSRPFLNRVFLLNPDKAAIVMWQQNVYAKTHDPNEEMPYHFHAGRLLHQFDGIDYVFEEFPRTLSISGENARVKKERISQLTDYMPAAMAAVIENDVSAEAAATFLQSHSLYEPDNELYLALLSDYMKPDDYIAFLRPKLDTRPVLVEWHRMYQTTMEKAHPEYAIEEEYRTRLEKGGDDPSMLYLVARATLDLEKSDALHKQACESPKSCAYSCFALAHRRLGMGQFEEALRLSQQAIQSSPESDSFQYVHREVLFALRRFDELIELTQKDRKDDPVSPQLALDEMQYRLAKGEKEVARKVIDDFAKRLETMEETASSKYWRTYLEANYRYMDGDALGFSQRFESPSGDLMGFQVAFNSGKLDNASNTLAKLPNSAASNHLLLHLAAASAGTKELAEQQLQLAIVKLQAGRREDRLLAECLTGKREPNAAEICALSIDVPSKRIALAAMGVRFPQQRDKYFALARLLNYDTAFPHLFLKKIVG